MPLAASSCGCAAPGATWLAAGASAGGGGGCLAGGVPGNETPAASCALAHALHRDIPVAAAGAAGVPGHGGAADAPTASAPASFVCPLPLPSYQHLESGAAGVPCHSRARAHHSLRRRAVHRAGRLLRWGRPQGGRVLWQAAGLLGSAGRGSRMGVHHAPDAGNQCVLRWIRRRGEQSLGVKGAGGRGYWSEGAGWQPGRGRRPQQAWTVAQHRLPPLQERAGMGQAEAAART